jgi:hypothetical protein
MEDRKIDRIIDIVRNYIYEDVPINNASSGNIAGLPPDQPPVKLKKRYIYPKNVKGYRSIWRQK